MQNDGSNSHVVRLPVDALFIDRDSREPIQRQIYMALRDLILRRVLTPGVKLPATRELSRNLSVSRNTVVRVYEQLNSEGYVETLQGSRTYVANLPSSSSTCLAPDTEERSENLAKFARTFDADKRIDFASEYPGLRPSTPDIATFPFKTWNRILGRSFLRQNVDLFNYNYSMGYPPLQEAIAKYLQAYRGVRCDAEQVIVTNGAQAGLDLLARILLEPGDNVWMEDPGYVNARLIFKAVGAEILPLKVSGEGWDLQHLPTGSPRVIYTTPSSQHPLGITMRIEQRLRLLDIAYRSGAWVIEDDYDSEYRLHGRSIPAMQGNDEFRQTIYIGTFAKTLFPALRVGFIVLPHSIVERARRAALYSGNQVALPIQATLTEFIRAGHFARHLRRTRRLYAQRRAKFLDLTQKLLGQWLEPFEADVGIQVAFRFKRPFDDAAIAAAANLMRLNVIPLSRYYQGAPVRGLFLGYAAISESAMREHLTALAAVIGTYAE